MTITKLSIQELHRLTELHDYKDVDEMMAQYTYEMENNIIDIFVLRDGAILAGELRAMYQSEDIRFAARGRRAYLFAFRIHPDYQSRGYGKMLLQKVISVLREDGYNEFTVGVEDDNLRAQHMYHSFGFNELLLRKQEEYQGDVYEYNLYLMR